jgi:LysR family hydrogen peroxide-inducible transcriptional activator
MIPALMAGAMSKSDLKTHVRPFKAPVPTREISFVYRRDHWKLDIISAIEKTIAQTLPKELKRKREPQQLLLEHC